MHLNIKLLLTAILFCVCSSQAQTPVPTTPAFPWLLFEMNDQATKLAKPAYPKTAADAQVSGRIEVWISLDEKGNILHAKLISGDPIFSEESVKAALASQFPAIMRDGKAVKADGWLVSYLPDASAAAEFKKKLEMMELGTQINSELIPISFLNGRGWLDTVDQMDPAIRKQAEALESFKNAPVETKYSVLVAEISDRVEQRLTGAQLWYYILGKKAGKLLAPFVKQLGTGKSPETDLIPMLRELKEYLKTAPPDLPYWMRRDLMQLTGLSEKKQITSAEEQKLLEEKILDVVGDLRHLLTIESPSSK